MAEIIASTLLEAVFQKLTDVAVKQVSRVQGIRSELNCLPPEGAKIKCTRTTSGLAWDAQVRETAWTVDPFLRVAMNMVYASNSDIERRNLWRDLEIQKIITNGTPWVIIGYFNVTLNAAEHSNGSANPSSEMFEFQDCVNCIEVDDLHIEGFYYTWTKSLRNPSCKTLKKLDRIMVNEAFIDKFQHAHGIFLSYMISDHSPMIVKIPNGVQKRKGSFRFSNFITDKKEFLPTVRSVWNKEIAGYNMYKVVHKLKMLKKKLKQLSWRNGNVFEKAESLRNEAVQSLNGRNAMFLNKLNNDEALKMIRQVSDAEIKNAMFDIEDSKAPGPDGYTSRFYKSAWCIIGKDVCNAVREFFITGKLLGEVNATLISLVPKIPTPDKVSDFKPIACCNVLYKCISKILTNRIKRVLGSLVDENQSAFIGGRQITNNILLSQELFRGYNRKMNKKKVAFKIDLQKAYDTISWEFIKEALVMFGFHEKMNIEDSGMFKYHYSCKSLKITHLCFADDLLVFCNRDQESVKVIKESLDEFSGVSGLVPNMQKSTIFFGGLSNAEQQVILNIIPFTVGKLPVRYLGVPLITKKISINDCKPLISKVKAKIGNWKNKTLSYAGRLQLIASVLSSMQNYWASVFLLPKQVIYDINKILKGFLWCQGDLRKGRARISWDVICKPKDQGGLGLKNMYVWNEVLMIKHLWNIAAKKDTLWVKWISVEKLKGKSIWEVQGDSNSSVGWKNILSLREKVRKHIGWKIGDGKSVNVWHDKWCNASPLSDFIDSRDIYDARLGKECTLNEIISDGRWVWPEEWNSDFEVLRNVQIPVLDNEVKDKATWITNNGIEKCFTVSNVWKDMICDDTKVDWFKLVWFSQSIPRHAFVTWLAIQKRLMTHDKILVWRPNEDFKCALCSNCPDSHNHLFFSCEFSKEIWKELIGLLNVELSSEWDQIIMEMKGLPLNKNIWSIVRRLVCNAAVYYIWQERNNRIFKNEKRDKKTMFNLVKENVGMKLSDNAVDFLNKSTLLHERSSMYSGKEAEFVASKLAVMYHPFSSVHDGKNMLKHMMSRRKTLVVLDDVDCIEQLEALAGEPNWYAFQEEIPTRGYEELSEQVVQYAHGLPLTIKVLGSFLCDQKESEWIDAIKRLKTIPLKATLERLEISFDGLEEDYKEIFLDVACILKGMGKSYAVEVHESRGFHAEVGLRVLEQKSLITYNEVGELGMHDHLEEMGRNIVRRSHPDEPHASRFRLGGV
ncbi:RNA-directed DNA polymerase, eukaryota, reverse transcriptase zinc-binding domain protein [Tanacetum coccineum]